MATQTQTHIQTHTQTQTQTQLNKNEIKARIECMSEDEMIEVFRIVKIYGEKYSSNHNGVFINISNFKQDTLNAIQEFIRFCNVNDRLFEQEEENRRQYREFIEQTNAKVGAN